MQTFQNVSIIFIYNLSIYNSSLVEYIHEYKYLNSNSRNDFYEEDYDILVVSFKETNN